jgi:CTD small phosphatase-like protein 2
LDLDETLIHYDEQSGFFGVRPYAEEFIAKMAEHYEIVIFTAGMRDYADDVLARIGNGYSQKHINHRLYREHALPCQDFFIKDLSLLGRDLSKTIILDNNPDCFLL